MRTITLAIVSALALAALTHNAQAAQSCEYEPQAAHWLTISSAPHDAVIEVIDASSSGPWYGVYEWNSGAWVRLNHGGPAISDHNSLKPSECLFWRPFSGSVESYVDPTAGREYTIEYWCEVWGLPYNKKRNVCKGF